jgi:hypothetical protein
MKKGHQTREELIAAAKPFSKRTEFQKNCPAEYRQAWKEGILDFICSHMPKQTVLKGKDRPGFKWSDEALQQESLKYNTRGAFAMGSSGAYQTAHNKGILDQICKHMEEQESWPMEKIHEKALLCTKRGEFAKRFPVAYTTASKLKKLDEVCSHMEESIQAAFSEEELKQSSLSCKYKSEFRTRFPGQYSACIKRKKLEEYCSHMVPQLEYWPKEKALEKALSCSTAKEFQKKYPSAYNAIRRFGLQEEASKHMKRFRSMSSPEIELLNIIKTIYPGAKKIRKTKLNIENRPYVHMLELDIFVAEKNKGVEFDGTHWHSLEGLRSGHKGRWPEEALLKYHEIKDSYFLSQGIQILHIK